MHVYIVEEQLFRSVEGQAASDEEEERWTGEQQRQVDEVKRILTRLSCCGDRYTQWVHKCPFTAVYNYLIHSNEIRAGAMVGHSRAVPPLAVINAPPTTVDIQC